MDLAKRGKLYELYLRTPHFEGLRIEALERAGYKCQACGSTEILQVHHNSYERITQEWLSDLFVLCQGCHTQFHSVRPLCGLQLAQIDWVAMFRFVRDQLPNERVLRDAYEGADYRVCPNCGKHLDLNREYPFCDPRCERELKRKNENSEWGLTTTR